jgi:hypothetical protein
MEVRKNEEKQVKKEVRVWNISRKESMNGREEGKKGRMVNGR